MKANIRVFCVFLLSFGVITRTVSAGPTTVKVGPETVKVGHISPWLPRQHFSTELSEAPKRTYEPRYATIGHEILQTEAAIGTVTDDMFRMLDGLIDEAKLSISGAPTTHAEILSTCKTIDELLIRHGFVYPPVGLTQLLSDGMTAHTVTTSELQQILVQPHNARRRAYATLGL